MISRENPIRNTPFFELLMLLCALFITMMFSGAAMQSLAPAIGIADVQDTINNFNENTPQETITAIKILHIVGQLFLFVLTPLLFLAIIKYPKPFHYLFLDRIPKLKHIFMGMAIILLSFPVALLIYWINKQLPLPESLLEMEESTTQMIKHFIRADNMGMLALNLFAIAFLPALGEELLFRGTVQRIFGRRFKSAHFAILGTAFLFSAFHMQFAGFLPRLLLGALLGYLMYWSASLWIPIIAHFVYNGFQVAGAYYSQQRGVALDPDNLNYLPSGSSIVALVLLAGLCYYMYKSTREEQIIYENRIVSDEGIHINPQV